MAAPSELAVIGEITGNAYVKSPTFRPYFLTIAGPDTNKLVYVILSY